MSLICLATTRTKEKSNGKKVNRIVIGKSIFASNKSIGGLNQNKEQKIIVKYKQFTKKAFLYDKVSLTRSSGMKQIQPKIPNQKVLAGKARVVSKKPKSNIIIDCFIFKRTSIFNVYTKNVHPKMEKSAIIAIKKTKNNYLQNEQLISLIYWEDKFNQGRIT